ncbi:ABC transporter ATP-binding protein [Jeotgalicoccus psychrophilus]|uniref:ABC transporter ATP-binding protein n=1 Tax=Jeotgalicoccus psychrophilus TaxID=157228 RepID=UPI000425B436|nr:ABC transporter ATP-binding protein [Jeotgalicoccus psychrophilus]
MELTNISKKYRSNVVLDNINFTMDSNVTGLIGKNGAGKTTIMKIMCSIIQNYSGTVNKNDGAEIGYLIEEPKYYKNKSGEYNIEYFTKIYTPNYDKIYINSLLEQLGMTGYVNKKMKTYSMGMKQKLGLVIALARKPEYLILDEPTNGMDPDGSIEVLSIIRKLAADYGMKVLISSHKLEDIEAVSDDIVFIDKGKLSSKENVEQLSTTVTMSFVFDNEDTEFALNVIKGFDDNAKLTENIVSTTSVHLLQEILKALSVESIYPADINKQQRSVKDYYFTQMKGGGEHENQ